jgi:hypothetical protein
MTVSMTERIPCRYIVARYVEDDVRDEPVNLGIIVQSQKDYETICKFITHYSYKNLCGSANIKKSLVAGIMKKIEDEVSSMESNKNVLNEIMARYGGKIRFTEPRGTLAEDLSDEAYSLFDRYVSIKRGYELKKLPITHYSIRHNVSKYLHRLGKPIRTALLIEGMKSRFRYDIVLRSQMQFFHAISFEEVHALERTKLFDWAVKDTMPKYRIHEENFGAIVSEPSPHNPRFEKQREQFKEGIKILSTSGYLLVAYEKDSDRWKKKISELV